MKKSSFLIDVRYHQHNSWQGSIHRLDNGEIINFRSALELITLIEGAVSEQREEQESNQEQLRTWSKKKEVKSVKRKSIG